MSEPDAPDGISDADADADDNVEWGKISITNRENFECSGQYDRLAVDAQGRMVILSLIADAIQAKGFRAQLTPNSKSTLYGSGGMIGRPSRPSWTLTHSPGRMAPVADGYTMHSHPIGFGMVHAMFIARTPGLLRVMEDEALWQELHDNRLTTPLLREWMPYLRAQLTKDRALTECFCFRCNAGMLTLETAHLDRIVSRGLIDGSIEIPPPATSADAEPKDSTQIVTIP